MLKKWRGIGLIETLITFLLIAGSIVALIQFQGYLAYSNSVIQQQADALNIALQRVETLRDFVTLTGSNSYQNITSGSATTAGTTTTYTTTWTVTTLTNPNYKVLDVSVAWTDRRGTAQTIRLTSRVAGIDPAYSAAII